MLDVDEFMARPSGQSRSRRRNLTGGAYRVVRNRRQIGRSDNRDVHLHVNQSDVVEVAV